MHAIDLEIANVRHLLMGSRKGHIAAFDWREGKLYGEVELEDQVRDVTYGLLDSIHILML